MSNTQTTIRTQVFSRLAILALVRTVDFEKLAAESPDGKFTLEDIKNKGDFSITIESQNSKVQSQRIACESLLQGEGFFAGFALAASMTKPIKSPEEKAAEKEKRAAKKAEKAAAKEAAAKAAAEASPTNTEAPNPNAASAEKPAKRK